MGVYVLNKGGHPAFGKPQSLVTYGGEMIEAPERFPTSPEGGALICVVTNPTFEAARVVPDQDDLDYVSDTRRDNRPRTWLVIPPAVADRLDVPTDMRIAGPIAEPGPA